MRAAVDVDSGRETDMRGRAVLVVVVAIVLLCCLTLVHAKTRKDKAGEDSFKNDVRGAFKNLNSVAGSSGGDKGGGGESSGEDLGAVFKALGGLFGHNINNADSAEDEGMVLKSSAQECTVTCRHGYTLQKREGHEVVPNGCGTGMISIKTDYDFTPW